MVQGKEYRGRSAVPSSFFQCRVSPVVKGVSKKHPINYDSTLIFPVREMAEKYMSLFIKQLYELDMLKPKQRYETAIIQLATYVPEVGED